MQINCKIHLKKVFAIFYNEVMCIRVSMSFKSSFFSLGMLRILVKRVMVPPSIFIDFSSFHSKVFLEIARERKQTFNIL